MQNTFISIAPYLGLSAFLVVLLSFAAGCAGSRKADVTRDILDYATASGSFADAVVAKRYQQVLSAYELGLISFDEFEAKRKRLDIVEDSLAIFHRSVGVLRASVEVKSGTMVSDILAVVEAAGHLVKAIEAAGLELPTELSDLVTFVLAILGDVNE